MAVDTRSGVDGSVMIGTTPVQVLAISSWDFTSSREALKGNVFGDLHSKIHGMGVKDVSGSIKGYYSVDDITGQETLKSHYLAGTTVTGFKLYIDDTIHFHATGTDDIDGVKLTSFNTGAEMNGIVPIEFNFEVGGEWTEVTI